MKRLRLPGWVPARRTYWLLGLGAIAALGVDAVVARPPAIAVGLGWDGVVLLLMMVDSWRARSQRVVVRREAIGRLSVGRANPVTLHIQGLDRAPQLQIQDAYPQDFAADPSRLIWVRAAGWGQASGAQGFAGSDPSPELTEPATAIPTDGERAIAYHITPNRRGEVIWGDLALRQLGPWGLGWYDWQIPARATATVYPDLHHLRELTIRLTQTTGSTLRQRRTLGLGTEFAELRDYVPGDDLRLIDWKATARRAKPVMRVLEPEREQTVIILLDRGRLMTEQIAGLPRFDWAMRAGLGLMLAALHRGDRVGLAVFDREVITWLPPDRGMTHFTQAIERLAPLQPVLLEPDYVGAIAQITQSQTRRALIVTLFDLVDAIASAELLAALGRLAPRHLPFCVALRDPNIDRLAAPSATVDRTAAYTRAVAIDLLDQRQRAFAQLRQRGALVLDAPAPEITDPLIEQYLQLKSRSRL